MAVASYIHVHAYVTVTYIIMAKISCRLGSSTGSLLLHIFCSDGLM